MGRLTVAAWPLRDTAGWDRDLAAYWPEPHLEFEPELERGPGGGHRDLHRPVAAGAGISRGNGPGAADAAADRGESWDLFRDGAAPDSFVEIARYPTWAEHLRQHTGRLTGRDRAIDETATALADGPPQIRHLFSPGHGTATVPADLDGNAPEAQRETKLTPRMTVQSGRGGRTSVVIDPTEAHDRPAESTAGARGAKQTLDARLAQTRDGKLGHLEFLQVLCEDEIARRGDRRLGRVRRARFEQTSTFEDFDFTVSPKLPGRDAARPGRAALARRPGNRSSSTVPWGRQNPCGTSTGPPSSRPGPRPLRQEQPHARRPRRRTRRPHRTAGCVNRPPDRARPGRLRDARAHPRPKATTSTTWSPTAPAAPLILTSNRAPKDWYPLFPNPVVAESLLDRLINTSHQVLMDGARPTDPGNDPGASRTRGPRPPDNMPPTGQTWGIT